MPRKETRDEAIARANEERESASHATRALRASLDGTLAKLCTVRIEPGEAIEARACDLASPSGGTLVLVHRIKQQRPVVEVHGAERWLIANERTAGGYWFQVSPIVQALRAAMRKALHPEVA